MAAVVLFASCAEIDDLEPVTEINADTAFNTEDDVIASLNAAYDPLQWQAVGGQQTFPLLSQGVRADDLHSQSASFWAIGAQYDQFSTIIPSLPSVASLWSKWYRAVGRANFTIDLASNFENYETEGLQQQIVAEARFLRGLYYFELVRLWGGVPLFEEPITSSEQEIFKPRSTAAEVYAFIEADLQAAASVLSQRGSERVQGSATSGAALGLLTKVFLYQEKWSDAVASAEQVINQGVYSLEEDFRNNFLQTTEFGPESLFEINYQDGLFAGGFNNTNQQQEGSGMWRWSFPFLSGTYPSFNNFIPRQDLVDFFDDSDQRKEATFLLPGQVLNSPGLAALGFDPTPDNFGYAIGVNTGSKKYFLTFEEVQELLNVEGSPLNEKILRYADVLLMHAEASLMGGGGNGQASFQQVIDRAYGPGNPAAPSYTIQGVRDERRRELATEGWNRFTDLVRWEILDGGDVIGPALQAIGKTDFSAPRDLLLPIPQQEIDTYPDGMLEQNPGY
ncbi:RagB/SusD family nutrient uptake outer membrane protein [Allomuricauda sp. SCSIO 65647]|uniref:RagB/SusD family nutrient uptake outer membrane protein n=1 Tax=Allomuricauda sp. SCSIO 65647 TaxID=2908843 RepID=UPI001F1D504F|nr:RagB/SusD family nutrient uptake outer membrane protein [Muricauda sp. SCSIO 65647]UJH68510.1 RagB/SusD family nutrient uptake outer membrane protein [Muricauda sp. SCSIO 65647]